MILLLYISDLDLCLISKQEWNKKYKPHGMILMFLYSDFAKINSVLSIILTSNSKYSKCQEWSHKGFVIIANISEPYDTCKYQSWIVYIQMTVLRKSNPKMIYEYIQTSSVLAIATCWITNLVSKFALRCGKGRLVIETRNASMTHTSLQTQGSHSNLQEKLWQW